MLHAYPHAARPETDVGDTPITTPSRRRVNPAQALSGLFAFGQTWLLGSCCDLPNDHLLEDIGISRADIEAMRF